VPKFIHTLTGQFADKPTHGQSSRGLDSSRTGRLAEMFDGKFGKYNCSKCDIYKFAVGELTSPQVDQFATLLTVSWFVGELSGYPPYMYVWIALIWIYTGIIACHYRILLCLYLDSERNLQIHITIWVVGSLKSLRYFCVIFLFIFIF